MKIRVDDISESGMEVSADTVNNAWYKNILIDVLGPDRFKTGDGGRLTFQIARSGDNITIVGGSILKFHPTCDRCLAVFEKQQQVPINLMLSKVIDGKPARKEEDVPVDDDEDFGFYKGDKIDIGDIVREHVLLAQEIVNLCKDDCKGICQSCGKNLNKTGCVCGKKKGESSPFAVLKKLQKP